MSLDDQSGGQRVFDEKHAIYGHRLLIGDDMAECNVSIDQDKLPGVKEVCRDFAVLEDHCLAYNLQEQEIESHLASNVHKSRLVQQDLQVAKKLQEEEDEIAKVVIKKQHVAIARQDNEIAHEIQDELVRQAEQQRRQQEEKDAAMARKLHEKEMKDERRRQKQLDEEYYEDTVAGREPLDLDKPTHHTSSAAGRYDMYSPMSSQHEPLPDYNLIEPKRSRYPKQDPAAPHSRSRYPEHSLVTEGGQGRYADPYPDHLLSDKGRHGDRYPDYDPAESRRARDITGEDPNRAVRKKEGAAHSPLRSKERDKGWDRDREKDRRHDRDSGWEVERDYHLRKQQRSDRDQDMRSGRGGRDRERSREREHGEDRNEARDKQTHKSKDTQRARARSRERELTDDFVEPRGGRMSREEEEDDARRARRHQRVHSEPDDVFEDHRKKEGRGDSRDLWETSGNHTLSIGETGRIVHKGSGAVIDPEYGLGEATRDMTKLDLREQELKDMEVARRMQEEEVKASKSHVRAAQVAQDEEMARQLMEQEKKEYRKHREREKEREREREEKERQREKERAMEKRRPEAEYRPNSEDVVRPRTREEHDHQRHRNHYKPSRPPHPRTHDYENVNPSYGYVEHPHQRAPSRPEAAYKGYKR
ncbi:coiled-coil domain-containing protein 50 isoform X1 [Corythoichthys intestinalis]|uniref:coiled-coil domain-containing protein 50 isoform X1 n=1 Tax=Corythoichthys intestinalis TaxID=161448 RepID=UPI0025A5D495|nr:coiled-coil domain-containing protein 50 isoform X1 [Corythoichthys intestinalis]